MAVNLSPVGGVAAQFFDNNGNPLSGGKLYTYAAGTTTPLATYTTVVGDVAHTNPIILDSAGRVPSGQIWLTDSAAYKVTIKTSADVLVGSYDGIIDSGVALADALRADLAAPFGSSLVGYLPAGAGAAATTVQGKLREYVSDKDFGLVGGGIDETDKLTAFFNSAIANPGIPHTLQALIYGTTAELPTINKSGVIILGVGSSIHDVGTLFTGTVIKYIGVANPAVAVQRISSVSGASNQKLNSVTYTGIGIDCNNLTGYGLFLTSVKGSVIDVAIANATDTGMTINVVDSLGEARDTQRNRIRFQGRQIESPGGKGLVLGGDSGANTSMNEIWADISHANAPAIIEANADNNDWVFVRTYRIPTGTTTEAVSWFGGASELTSCRGERFWFLTGNLPSKGHGTTDGFTVGATNINIIQLDTDNGTPAPIVSAGASVNFQKQSTPFGDTPWVDYTPVITAASGTFTSVSAIGRFLKRGKIVNVQFTITITTNGTAAVAVHASLPLTVSSAAVGQGKETIVTGNMVSAIMAGTNAAIQTSTGAYPGGDGRSIIVTGEYEIA